MFGEREAVAKKLEAGPLSVAVNGTGGVVVKERGSTELWRTETVAK